MTYNDIATRCRELTGDIDPGSSEGEGYRFDDAELRRHAKAALRRLNSRAPQTRYVGGVVTDYTPLPVGDDDELVLDDRYEEAIAMYMAAQCFLDDETDTQNAERGAALLSRAEGMMV